jgi:hypothetical protein
MLRTGVQGRTGREIVFVVHGGAAQADPARTDATLHDARWVETELADGETAAMEVSADGADGRTVRFTVERKDGDAWRAVATLDARVGSGKARATHIAEADDGGEAELRFHCSLV